MCVEIRFTIFTWVSRGLAEKHKLIYMCQIAFKMMARGDLGDESENFKPSYLNFLLKGTRDVFYPSQYFFIQDQLAVHPSWLGWLMLALR